MIIIIQWQLCHVMVRYTCMSAILLLGVAKMIINRLYARYTLRRMCVHVIKREICLKDAAA